MNQSAFKEGFAIGKMISKGAARLVLALYLGEQGSVARLAKVSETSITRTGDYLRMLHRSGFIHIVGWHHATSAIYAYGKGEDAKPPVSRNVLQIERSAKMAEKRIAREKAKVVAAEKVKAQKAAARRAKYEAFLARTNAAHIDAADHFRRTTHGVETVRGAVRTHRME